MKSIDVTEHPYEGTYPGFVIIHGDPNEELTEIRCEIKELRAVMVQAGYIKIADV